MHQGGWRVIVWLAFLDNSTHCLVGTKLLLFCMRIRAESWVYGMAGDSCVSVCAHVVA